METQNTDVMVIGLGVGGELPAGKLAEAGLHVTGVEAKLVAVDRFTGNGGHFVRGRGTTAASGEVTATTPTVRSAGLAGDHDAGQPVPSETNG
jgi:pyruvate/2-oxoglutarate dehydrogenase complex dihydrolipoamide dehydrogenase (E3) component